MKNFIILTPVYNDWDNLSKILGKINIIAAKYDYKFKILVVNDKSDIKSKIRFKKTKNIIGIQIFNLPRNVGSQRAIALGLRKINNLKGNKKNDIIIMDADGQDDPKILKNLIDKSKKSIYDITVVERLNRDEPNWFRLLYIFHKTILFLFTGKHIRFGNFSLIKFNKLKSLINTSDLWAAYPAAITNNLSKIQKIKSDRSPRFSGETKMNLKKLFLHSSRVFSVFRNRILITSFIYSFLIMTFFKDYALPLISVMIVCNVYNFTIHLNNLKEFKKSYKISVK